MEPAIHSGVFGCVTQPYAYAYVRFAVLLQP
jgi:hypothetical protein